MYALVLAALIASGSPRAAHRRAETRAVESPSGPATVADGYGRSRWGMTPEEVRALYPKGRLNTAGDVLAFHDRVGRFAAVISFFFTARRLSSVMVAFPMAQNSGLGMSAEVIHARVELMMIEKYGDGFDSSTGTLWRSPSDQTAITFGLTSPDPAYAAVILYTDTSREHAAERADDTAAAEKL